MDSNLQLDTKKALLEALEAYHGIISDACRKVGISRQTYYDWLKSDPDLKLAAEEIGETAIDFVEGKLFEKINGVTVKVNGTKDEDEITYQQAPSDTAIIFYLKTKAKKRGYIERTENEHIFPSSIRIIRDKDA